MDLKELTDCIYEEVLRELQERDEKGIAITSTLGQAIRYWLWHCGVPAKIEFWGVKRM